MTTTITNKYNREGIQRTTKQQWERIKNAIFFNNR